jgi:hypothetical protein
VAARAGPMDEVQTAYLHIERELDAVPTALVGRVTTDVPTATSLAIAAIPLLEGLVPEMKKQLAQPPVAEIGRLRDRALALLYTHLRWVPRTSKNHEADLEEARVRVFTRGELAQVPLDEDLDVRLHVLEAARPHLGREARVEVGAYADVRRS